MRTIKDKMADAVGPRQFGVGAAGGAEAAVNAIKVAMAIIPDAAVISLDTTAAFQSVRRKEAITAAMAIPEFAYVLRHWYNEATTHQWKDGAGSWQDILAEAGLDQGRILAALGFAVDTRAQLEETLAAIRVCDP